MPDTILVALPILLIALGSTLSLYQSHQGRKRLKQALRDSFRVLGFSTPDGTVGGNAVRVVKVYRQGMPLVYDDVFEMHSGRKHLADSFWYCVGPGPSYFVAIPMVEVAGWGRLRVQWAVRSLTAERMRAALQDDKAALRDLSAPPRSAPDINAPVGRDTVARGHVGTLR